jgi:hypothetical protein
MGESRTSIQRLVRISGIGTVGSLLVVFERDGLRA